MSFQKTKLSNGLQVLTFKMEHVNSVALNIMVNTGSRHENHKELGFSHIIEHMLFKGTKTHDVNEIAKAFDAMGGNFNAYTTKEHTMYYGKFLPEHLKKSIILFADITKNSVFDTTELNKEIDVIKQEILNSTDNPEDYLYDNFYELIYPNHPLGRPIAGKIEDMEHVRRTDLIAYMNKHYSAKNIFISVAGQINHDEVHNLLEKYFSGIKSNNYNTQHSEKSCIYNAGYKFMQRDLLQDHVLIGFQSVSYQHLMEFYKTCILSIILGGSMSSRLFQNIREKLGIVYHIGCYNTSYLDTGIINIYSCANHNNIELLANSIIHEINNIANHISEYELEIAKSQIKANLYMSDERVEHKSEEIVKNFVIFRKFFTKEDIMKMIYNISTDDIKSMAIKFLTKPSLSVLGTKENTKLYNIVQQLY